ncbi:DUF4384 domain-containing protein [bacterium]|nr:DUF4384 domain-containing protein [bacterium]
MKTLKNKAAPAALALALALLTVAPAAAQEAGAKGFDFDQVGLRAAVWLDKGPDEVYQRGDRLKVGFQVNEDAYAVVYRIDTEGGVTVLWPRSRLDDGFVFAGHEYKLPVGGAAQIFAGNVEGEGFVQVLASRYPFDLRALEIDFHHEVRDGRFDFYVAGDPFLAMNEVNYAITGLEDSEDYVVTNYASYYVHRKVDHPRYLCNQCHLDDEVVYDPYDDHCTLEITYDYGWGNNWYDHHGYYPVYYQPVYVYVDPWTYRPWVNFWYWPHYTCGPYYGYSWHSTCWAWSDSPYYWGDVYYGYDGGRNRYRPLTPYDGDRTARKTREYARATPLVGAEGPGEDQRQAMRTRTPLRPTDVQRTRGADPTGGSRVAGSFVGQDPAPRSRPVIETSSRDGSAAGLRIREPNKPAGVDAPRTREDYRHRAAGDGEQPALSPVTRTRTPDRAGGARVAPGVDRAAKPAQPGDRTIKPVEPRKKGTRIWNSSPGSTDRGTRSPQVAPRRQDSGSRSEPRVQPRQERGGDRPVVKPRSDSSSRTKDRGSSTPKVDNSRSRGGDSSSGSSRGGGSSGGSRSGGGSGSSRGGSRSSDSSGGRQRSP